MLLLSGIIILVVNLKTNIASKSNYTKNDIYVSNYNFDLI